MVIAHQPFENGREIVAAGAGLARAQERPWAAGLVNVVTMSADGDVGLIQSSPRTNAAGPFGPNHDFTGNPAIERPIILPGAAAGVESAGQTADRGDRLIDGFARVWIGFDAAGVRLLAVNPEMRRGTACGIDVERLRARTTAPNIVINGVAAQGERAPLGTRG